MSVAIRSCLALHKLLRRCGRDPAHFFIEVVHFVVYIASRVGTLLKLLLGVFQVDDRKVAPASLRVLEQAVRCLGKGIQSCHTAHGLVDDDDSSRDRAHHIPPRHSFAIDILLVLLALGHNIFVKASHHLCHLHSLRKRALQSLELIGTGFCYSWRVEEAWTPVPGKITDVNTRPKPANFDIVGSTDQFRLDNLLQVPCPFHFVFIFSAGVVEEDAAALACAHFDKVA
mmetsp:Transcript_13450/g.33571  ORF Transcript_13450/g.33571 Transcript_13450/m.33571 type:complete len:228 (-) Transcript_13450:318-1001(-)